MQKNVDVQPDVNVDVQPDIHGEMHHDASQADNNVVAYNNVVASQAISCVVSDWFKSSTSKTK